MPGYAFDNSGAGAELGDFALIRASFPEVAILGELLQAHAPGMGFNEAQLRLHAQAGHFVSVLGGNAVLASYFAGVNVVYAVEGTEVKNEWEYGELYARLAGRQDPARALVCPGAPAGAGTPGAHRTGLGAAGGALWGVCARAAVDLGVQVQ